MAKTRRDFLSRIGTGAVALGGLSLAGTLGGPELAHAAASIAPEAEQGTWNVAWTDRMTGRVRTVFDVPEIESGFGLWRASIWASQYEAVLRTPASQLSTALVLRHNAIALAMTQAFWDRYGIGEYSRSTHPLTDAPTSHNPALLGPDQGVPAPYDAFALPKFIERGGIALACDLALRFLANHVAKKDGVSVEIAYERSVAGLQPNVILQPSGVFAVLRAQEAKQAIYIRAS